MTIFVKLLFLILLTFNAVTAFGEGTRLDSHWGTNNNVNQATSFNILLGKNLAKVEDLRFAGAAIIGLREASKDCPRSYLGYQCYADTRPETKYDLNYGILLTMLYKRLMVGIRATGESTQALIGFGF